MLEQIEPVPPPRVWDLVELEEQVIAHAPADAVLVHCELTGESLEEIQRDCPDLTVTEVPADQEITIVYEDEPAETWLAFVREHGKLLLPGGHMRYDGSPSQLWEAKLPASRWVELEGRGYLCGENW